MKDGVASDETPFPFGKISIQDASWVASLQCVGSLFGNIILGYCMNKFGRRVPLILIAFPLIVSFENGQNIFNVLAYNYKIFEEPPSIHKTK